MGTAYRSSRFVVCASVRPKPALRCPAATQLLSAHAPWAITATTPVLLLGRYLGGAIPSEWEGMPMATMPWALVSINGTGLCGSQGTGGIPSEGRWASDACMPTCLPAN